MTYDVSHVVFVHGRSYRIFALDMDPRSFEPSALFDLGEAIIDGVVQSDPVHYARRAYDLSPPMAAAVEPLTADESLGRVLDVLTRANYSGIIPSAAVRSWVAAAVNDYVGRQLGEVDPPEQAQQPPFCIRARAPVDGPLLHQNARVAANALLAMLRSSAMLPASIRKAMDACVSIASRPPPAPEARPPVTEARP